MLTVAVVEGLGLAVKSRLAVQEELNFGALTEVMPTSLYDADAPISFVYAAENRFGRKTKAFHQLARQAFQR